MYLYPFKNKIMYKVDTTTINNLSQKAKASDRRRMNPNIHKTEDDVMQRFLNAT